MHNLRSPAWPSRKFFLTAIATLSTPLLMIPAESHGAAEPPLSFDFDNSFWLNLHHRLFRHAEVVDWEQRGYPLANERPSRYREQGLELVTDFNRLSSDQRAVWRTALQAYISGGYTQRDLLFDDRLTAVKEALTTAAPGATPATSDALNEQLQRALVSAAPVYRDSSWPSDDRSNADWVANAKLLVSRYGTELTRRLSSVYQWRWPLGPYRVDVLRYANALGAYTTTGPVHIVIASGDSQYAGTAALEMLFHEASHSIVTRDYSTIGTAIENACAELRTPEPDGLWHAVIFYTVGSVVSKVVQREHGTAYTMYADAAGIFRGPWKSYREPLAKHWQPYIDGRGSLAAALASTVKAIVESNKAVGPA